MRRRALLGLVLALAVAAPAAAQTRSIVLINNVTLAAAGTFVGDPVNLAPGTASLGVLSKFVRAGGGTSTKVFLQTSLDGGTTWIDVAQHAFLTTTASKVTGVKTAIARAVATPTDGTLADDTVLDGLIGDRVRVKYIVAGTYTGASTLSVVVVAN